MARISKVLSLSLPPALSKEAGRVAKEENRTRSELFREALRQYVSRKRWEKIRGWGTQTAARFNLDEEEVAADVRSVRQGG